MMLDTRIKKEQSEAVYTDVNPLVFAQVQLYAIVMVRSRVFSPENCMLTHY